MSIVDYDQVARFEAASELLNTLMGMCISLQGSEVEYISILEERYFELSEEKQSLKTKDDEMVKNIIDTYGPLVRSYYSDTKGFKLTKSFLETKVSYENRS